MHSRILYFGKLGENPKTFNLNSFSIFPVCKHSVFYNESIAVGRQVPLFSQICHLFLYIFNKHKSVFLFMHYSFVRKGCSHMNRDLESMAIFEYYSALNPYFIENNYTLYTTHYVLVRWHGAEFTPFLTFRTIVFLVFFLALRFPLNNDETLDETKPIQF